MDKNSRGSQKGSNQSRNQNHGRRNFYKNKPSDDHRTHFNERKGRADQHAYKFEDKNLRVRRDSSENRSCSTGNLQKQEFYGSNQSLPCFQEPRDKERSQNKKSFYKQGRPFNRTRGSYSHLGRRTNKTEGSHCSEISFDDDFSSSCSSDSYQNKKISALNVRSSSSLSVGSLSNPGEKYPIISVYWDIENCSIPNGKSVLLIVKQIRETFFAFHTEDEFIAVCDTSKIKKQILDDLNYSSVNVISVSSTSKNAADEILKRKLRSFGERHEPQSTVVILTSDINFVHDIHDLRYKKHMNVILIHNKHVNEALTHAANQCFVYEEFISNLSDSSTSCKTENDFYLLLVKNLPRNIDESKIRSCLENLFSLHRGKVNKICSNTSSAEIKFNSEADALNAKSRLQNEKVYGSLIEIECMKGLNNKTNVRKNSKAIRNSSPASTSKNNQTVNIPCVLRIKMSRRNDEDVLKLKKILSLHKLDLSMGNLTLAGEHLFTVNCHSFNEAKKVAKKMNCFQKDLIKVEIKKQALVEVHKDRGNFKDEIQKSLRQNQKKCEELEEKIIYLEKNRSLLEENSSRIKNIISVLNDRIMFLRRCEIKFKIYLDDLETVFNSSEGFNENKRWDKLKYECIQFDKCLPIYEYRKDIIDMVEKKAVFVLAGPPGCGKSTLLMQYVLEAELNTVNRKIVCIQPFVHLAVCHGTYVSQQTKNVFGNTIGYEMGKSSNAGSLQASYMSESTLLEEIQTDPLLMNYSCVIVDEVQENSLLTELLLAVLKQILYKREDFHVIVVCTCIVARDLSIFFGKCPVIEINYLTFPVIESFQTISNDYVKQSIAHAHHICKSKGTGDILIILPTLADVLRGVDSMSKESVHYENFKIIPLLLMNSFRDMRNQIEQNLTKNLRNIIFMMNGMENAVSLPSVSFVIDSGMKTEITTTLFYSIIETKQIDEVEVGERAKKAGTSFVGDCIHLVCPIDSKPSLWPVKYSEDRFLPLALLYVLSRGQNPLEFKLRHHPAAGSIKQTMDELTKMGLVEKQKLTTLGEKVIATPLPPHLSVLLWKSLERNDGYETLVLSAVADVMGSLNQVSCKDEPQSVDLLEASNLYIKWKNLNKKQREHLSNLHKTHSMVLRAVDQKVNELQNVLKKMNINLKMKAMTNDWQSHLKKLILENWHPNICIQQKFNHSIKYDWNFGNKTFHLLLKSDSDYSNLPQKIIFERIWKQGPTEYILHYVRIEESDLCHFKNTNEGDVEQTQVNLQPIGCHLIQTVIMGNNEKRLTFLETKLTKQFKSLVKLSVSPLQGCVTITAASKYQAKVLQELQRELQRIKNLMEKEILEYTLSKKSAVRVLMGKGAVINQILMPTQFVSLLFLLECGEKLSDVLDFCKNFGQIIYHSIKEVRNDKRQVVVMFAHPDMAQNALLNHHHLKFRVRARQCITKLKSVGHLQQVSTLQWVRRKNMGTCVIQLPADATNFSELDSLLLELISNRPFGDVDICKEFDKKRIVIKKLNQFFSKSHVLNTTNQYLLQLGSELLLNESNIQLTQEAGFKTSDEERVKMELELKTIFGLQANDQVIVHQPNDKDEVWNATIQVRFNEREKLQQSLYSNSQFSVSSEYHHSIFFSEMFFIYYYKFLHPKLQNYVVTNSLQVSLSLFEEEGQKGLKIVCQNFEAVTSLYNYFTTLMKPDAILIDNEYLCANDKRVLSFIARLNDDKSLFVHHKNLNDCLVMFGPTTSVSSIENCFHTESGKAMSLENDEIQIHCSSKGLIRKLISVYGLCLEKLQIPDLFLLKIDFMKRHLIAKGTDLARKKLIETVNTFVIGKAKEIFQVPNEASDEICPVCNDDINLNLEHSYRLEFCGHVYCLPCIKSLMINCKPPLVCLFKDCFKEIVFRDLKTFQAKHAPILERLVQNSLKLYIKSSTYAICPFPDCSGILVRNEEEQICNSCWNSVCTSCQVLYHYGQKCSDFKQKNGKTRSDVTPFVDDLITF